MLGKVLHVILRKEMLQVRAIDIKVTKVGSNYSNLKFEIVS